MGETVMTVVPPGDSEMLAKVYLDMKGSGKVLPGQDVYIKLNSYPYLQYGMVRGRVRSKSLVPIDDNYILDVELPDELLTFHNIELEFTQNMPGTAEIITDDMRLIQRLFDPFRFIIEKNKR